MIRGFQREKLDDFTRADWDALINMLVGHYDELTLNKAVVKLAPKWDEYFLLEEMGRFVVYTARDDAGTLVGYNAFFINTHMHYAGLTLAVNDVFYLHPAHRRGPAALRFLRYTEGALKALGAQKVAYHFKRSNNFGLILSRLGYADEEGVVGKII